jgi:rod shape-determining protein MreC
MKKKISKSYFLISAIVLTVMSLSSENSEKIRGSTAWLFNGFWENCVNCKISVLDFFSRFSFSKNSSNSTANEEIEQLRLKIQLLDEELRRFHNLLGEDLAEFFNFELDFLPAKIIFRTFSTWNSSFWLNVGSADNLKAQKKIIVQNSPVLIGTSIIGVIDYVGERQSRVRLITDSDLHPSVRVRRRSEKKTWFLAKGELHGSNLPLWRSKEQILHGIGFNSDFPDAAGPARDLRTGQPADSPNAPPLPIIKIGDLLVTTGLDGVFPAGLDVATVTKIHPLKEGDYYFEIEAKPTAGNLHDLSFVFVIPPIGFDS